MKAPLHHVVVQHIIERDQAHALMMRHERMNDDLRLIFRQPLRRVINRFVKPVARQCACLRQAVHILQRGLWRNQCGDNRCIRRNHQVFTQASLQPQPRHAKRAVLKIEM